MNKLCVFLLVCVLCLCHGKQAVCRENDQNRANDISGLPHFYRDASTVSNNIGSYNLFECTITEDNSGPTTIYTDDCDFADVGTYDNHESSDLWVYIESLAVYIVFAITMFFGIIAFSLCFCMGRYCCLCCGCCQCCEGGCCCKRYPTELRDADCICCKATGGIAWDEDEDVIKYSDKQVWFTRVWMAIFIIFICTWIGLGYQNGSSELTDAIKALNDQPSASILTAVDNALAPTLSFFQGFATLAVSNLLVGINSTFTSGIDMNLIVDELDCVINALENDLPDLSQVDVLIDLIEADIKSLVHQVGLANAEVTSMEAVATFLSDEVDIFETEVTTGDNALVSYTGASPDFLQSVQDLETELDLLKTGASYSLDTMETDLTDFNNGLPSTTDVDDVTSSGYASLTRIYATASLSASLPVGETNDLIDRLSALNNTYDALVDTSTVADNMETLNSKLGDASVKLGTINTNLQSIIDATADTATTLPAMNRTLYAALSAVDQVASGITNIIGVINTVNDTLVTMTDPQTFLQPEFDKVYALKLLLPCISRMVAEVLSVNDTLLELPSGVESITTIEDTLNSSLATAIEIVKDAEAEIASYDSSKDKFNMTDILLQADAMLVDVNAAFYDTLIDGFAELTNTAILVNFTYREEFITLNNTLTSNYLNQTIIDTLRTFQLTKDNLIVNLTTVLTDTRKYAMGHCSLDSTQLCDIDADCGGGTCINARTSRCIGEYGTTCTADTDCATRCMVDDARYQSLAALLYYSANIDLTDELNAVSSVTDAANSFTYGDLVTGINDTFVKAQDTTLQAVTDGIATAREGIASFDLSDLRTTIVDINNTIVAINLDGVNTEFGSVNQTLEDIEKEKQRLQNFKNLMNGLRTLFTDEFPDYLDRLSVDTIESLDPWDLPETILGVISDMFQHINASATIVNIDIAFDNQTGAVPSLEDGLYRVFSPEFKNYGAIYFLLASMKTEGIVHHSYPLAYRMFEDVNGDEYPDGDTCVLQDCIYQEVEYMNETPLCDLYPDHWLFGEICYSRSEIQAAPYFFPGFVAILCLLALILSFFKSNSCAGCCATASSGGAAACTFLTIPFILFFSLLFFTFVIGMGDLCYSWPSIILQYIAARGDAACQAIMNGDGTTDACSLTLVNDATVTFNFYDVVDAVVNECPDVDPFTDLYDSLASTIDTIPRERVDDLITSLESGALAFRPDVVNLFQVFGNDTGVLLSDMIVDLKSAWGCGTINDVVLSFEEGWCCDVMEALYWSFGSWVLIGWTLLLCGCPVSLCGRKRFATEPWGKDYEKMKSRYAIPDDATAENDGEKANLAGNAAPGQIELQPITGGGGAAPPPQVVYPTTTNAPSYAPSAQFHNI